MALGRAAEDESREALLLAFAAWIKTLKTYRTGDVWPSNPAELANLFVSQLPLEQYQLASHIIAKDGMRRFIDAAGIAPPPGPTLPGMVVSPPPPPGAIAPSPMSQWPADYQKAAEWLQGRDIMTVDEVKRLAQSVVPVTDASFPSVLAQLRSDNLALAGSTNQAVTARIRDMITSAIENGQTFKDFVDTLDEMVKDGQIPDAWSRSYAELVFRQETANAYAAQRDWLDRQEPILSHTWGYEFFNPDDDRSRDTHGPMNGVVVKYGSAAHVSSMPGPPWSYYCRCDRLPILVADPATETGYTETANAYELVSAIERF